MTKVIIHLQDIEHRTFQNQLHELDMPPCDETSVNISTGQMVQNPSEA